MADNETSYLPIGTCLEQIEKAVYGREVRKAIHDGIAQCYDDTVKGVNAAQQSASDTQEVIDNMTAATTRANNAAAAAENVNATASKVQDGPYQITVTNSQGTPATIEIPDPAAEVKKKANLEAVTVKKTVGPAEMVTFEDGVDAPAVLTKIKLEPKQDLHGYDHPWVGGAGKNLLPQYRNNTTISGTNFSWDDQGILTISNVNTGAIRYDLVEGDGMLTLAAGDYILSGGMVGNPESNNIRLQLRKTQTSSSTDNVIAQCYPNQTSANFTLSETTSFYPVLFISQNTTAAAFPMVWKPMITLASETDQSYEPYSNICPIEGYDAVNVRDAAKNILDLTELLNAPSGSIPGETYVFTHLLKLPVKKNTQYTLSTNYTYTNDVNLNVLYFNTSKSSGLVNSSATRTANSGEDGVLYIGFIERTGYLEFVNGSAHAQLEEGNSATEYAAYNGSTTFVSLASAGTVYSGEITLNEDGSATLMVDKTHITMDGESAGKKFTNKSGNVGSNNFFFAIAGYEAKYGKLGGYLPSATLKRDGFMCSIAPLSAGSIEKTASIFVNSVGSLQPRYTFDPDDEVHTTVEAANQFVAELYAAGTPLEYVIPLVEPSDPIQLTATQIQTLVGTNHVWTDAGEITLTYRSDKYAELERRLSQLEALVLES